MPDFHTVEISEYTTDTEFDLWPVIRGMTPLSSIEIDIVPKDIVITQVVVEEPTRPVSLIRTRRQVTHTIDISSFL